METAPKIDKEYQKIEVVVTKGSDVTLKVPYTGTPIPNSTWYHKGQPLDKDPSPKVRAITKERIRQGNGQFEYMKYALF